MFLKHPARKFCIFPNYSKTPQILIRDLSLAVVNSSLRHWKDAEENLKKAVTIDPKSIRARIDLADIYRVQNEIPEAQQALEAGIQTNPNARELYIALTNLLSGSAQPTAAEAVLDKLRNQMPKSSDSAIAMVIIISEKMPQTGPSPNISSPFPNLRPTRRLRNVCWTSIYPQTRSKRPQSLTTHSFSSPRAAGHARI